MLDKVWWVLKLLLPPNPADVRQLYAYHWTISTSLVGVWGLAWMAGLWMSGNFAFVPHLAWHSEIEQVNRKVDDVDKVSKAVEVDLHGVHLLTLRTNISQQLKDACLAKKAGNQAELDVANGQLGDLVEEYISMSGHPYKLPGCDTILVNMQN